MSKRRILSLALFIIATLLCAFFFYCFSEVKKSGIFEIGDSTYITFEDLENLKKTNAFGAVKFDFEKDEIVAGENQIKTGNVVFRLFNFLVLKKIEAKVISSEEVYLGGMPVGFAVKTDGVIVVGSTSVLTKEGSISSLGETELMAGDVLTMVDDKKIEDVKSLIEYVEKQGEKSEVVKLSVKRKEKTFSLMAKPLLDSSTNTYKLGLWIRDDASGIGTLTFVDKNNQFGALGHPISDSETGAKLNVQNGKVYPCSLIGIEKGKHGSPGRLKGVFLESKKSKGKVEKSTQFGLFGSFEDATGIIDTNKKARVGSRMVVRPGKAKLVSNVSGLLEEYDIEIIKASKQTKSGDKSMVLRVTDKKLLELTGGIVQGMSGSPIIQNGKVVGAVTHVFVSDPTKGYGVYIDWMLE